MESTGSKPYTAQAPFIACWSNLPLCGGMICIPYCSLATMARNMQAIDKFPGGKNGGMQVR